ncbi:MAG: hypothetical protein ACP6IS_03315 [Candidatus Asgardarchaeia archaeon]
MVIIKSIERYGLLLDEIERDLEVFISKLNEQFLVGLGAYDLFIQTRAGVTNFTDVDSLMKRFNSKIFLDITVDFTALDTLLNESKQPETESLYKQIIRYFSRRSVIIPILRLGGLKEHRFSITNLFDQSISDILPIFLEGFYVSIGDLESIFSYISTRINTLIFPKISRLDQFSMFSDILNLVKSKTKGSLYVAIGVLSLLLYPMQESLDPKVATSLAKEKYNLNLAVLEETISRSENSLEFDRMKTLILTPEHFVPRTNKLDNLLKYLIEERVTKSRETATPSYINELKDAIKKRRKHVEDNGSLKL